MKKVLLILLFIPFISCKKDIKGNDCYVCSFGIVNGYTRLPENYCGPIPHVWTDGAGNNIPVICIPK